MDNNNVSSSRQRKQRRNLSLEDKINIIKKKGVLQQHVEEDSSDEEEWLFQYKWEGRHLMWLEQRDFTTENDVKYIHNIIRRLDKSVEKAKRQTSLTEFINQ